VSAGGKRLGILRRWQRKKLASKPSEPVAAINDMLCDSPLPLRAQAVLVAVAGALSLDHEHPETASETFAEALAPHPRGADLLSHAEDCLDSPAIMEESLSAIESILTIAPVSTHDQAVLIAVSASLVLGHTPMDPAFMALKMAVAAHPRASEILRRAADWVDVTMDEFKRSVAAFPQG
jgi:hypothetical protein